MSLKKENLNKITVPANGEIELLDFENIIMLESEAQATKISLSDGCFVFSDKPLKYFAKRLEETTDFYRPHRDFLINLRFIKRFVKGDDGYILMDNDIRVAISKGKHEEFIRFINSI